jgi:hypothetical protein
MATATTNNVFAALAAIANNVSATNTIINRGVKRDTLDDARAKVVEKLHANKRHFLGDTTESVDTVYKQQADGTYAVGIKYGNRYLSGVINGQKYARGFKTEHMPAVFDTLAQQVEAGVCDDAIAQVMDANVGARNKTH